MGTKPEPGRASETDSSTEEAAEERRLVARLRAGDEAAFEELVRGHGPRLLVVARRIVRNEEDARDCVQEAFAAAHRKLCGFEERSRLATWLRRIVTNSALMKLRAQRSRPEEPIEQALPKYDRYGYLEGPIDTNSLGADELLDQAGARKKVRDAIEGLPDSYRTILLLRDIEGVDTEEAASALGITPGAARVRLHRARTALKAALEGLFE